MENKRYEIETFKPFSESLIWQLNRAYYQKSGLEAWRKGTVPHFLTSNSMVGKTYAELIFAFLKDLADKGRSDKKVYILELGAGHGRLSFHILKHLERLIGQENLQLPAYCYVLSDIVESNLDFFHQHPQLQHWFEKGILDLTYFDAVESEDLHLRHSNISISPQELDQPLIAIANYFFDSIPNDLFHFKEKEIFMCSTALESKEDPTDLDEAALLKNLKFSYHLQRIDSPFYEEVILNDMLEDYRQLLVDTYLFFPHKSLQCINRLSQLSQEGLMLLSMDKGYHQVRELETAGLPELISHGSISIWVNYHALGLFCEKHGGTAIFPSFSTFDLELACLLFTGEDKSFTHTQVAYQRFVNDFGPDDFNGLKKFSYKHLADINLRELLALLRLGAYDSTLFLNILPRLKQTSRQITFSERAALAQALHQTWDMYFNLNEPYDLAYEIGGLFYDLGFYQDALLYFQFSIKLFGPKADVFYNIALCHYQMRQDELFLQIVKEAKTIFPTFHKYEHLDKLDLGAA